MRRSLRKAKLAMGGTWWDVASVKLSWLYSGFEGCQLLVLAVYVYGSHSGGSHWEKDKYDMIFEFISTSYHHSMLWLQYVERSFIICVILTFDELQLTFQNINQIAIIAKYYLRIISFQCSTCHLEWYKNTYFWSRWWNEGDFDSLTWNKRSLLLGQLNIKCRCRIQASVLW